VIVFNAAGNEALVDLRRLYRPPNGAGLSEPESGRREVVGGWLLPAAPAGSVIEGHADPIDNLLNDRVSLDTP
jgi:hypothetical protein